MTGECVKTEPKPFASLSSGLLARKGQAKPAMRPQGFANGFGPLTSGGHDDLGWNDMGFDPPRPSDTEPVPLREEIAIPPADVPEVIRQREEFAEELGAAPDEDDIDRPLLAVKPGAKPVAIKPVQAKPIAIAREAAPRSRPKASAVSAGRKAAFTLRVDPERHLKLRLACAVGNRSAQQLVTEALDRYLDSLPELDDLADRVPARNAG